MLERREFLDAGIGSFHPFARQVQHNFPVVQRAHPIGDSPRLLSFQDNDGKVITGTTRNGDTWTLTVHGPGVAIVTDISPNDGRLGDQIDTIQLIGTDINSTYVTGQVTASGRVVSDGTIGFNRLIAHDGVASIILNGFELRETVLPPVSQTPEIFLPGGVRTLSFHAVDAEVDLNPDVPFEPVTITIGDPTTPLLVRPDIRIDHIYNTAFDFEVGVLDGLPITEPTVRIIVNGEIQNMEIVSATAAPVDAPTNARLTPVGFTGRTSIEALGVNGMRVAGSARNFTLSRDGRPFETQFSGMNRLGHAAFGGPADAVGLDIGNGPIGRLTFARGLGNPTGTSESFLESGVPLGQRGYPFWGLQGGVVSAQQINRQQFGPANLNLLIPQDPSNVQTLTTGEINYRVRPGIALTNATIASAGSIGQSTIVGDLQNSQINAGFNYNAYRQGLNPVRQASAIRNFHQRGDMVDSIVTSSYAAGADGIIGTENDIVGPGRIAGRFHGNLYQTQTSELVDPVGPGAPGVGFFARQLVGQLPSIGGQIPQPPRRIHSVLVR